MENELGGRERKFLLVLPVEMAPLSTEVLYAGYGVLHELKAKWDLLTLCTKHTVNHIYNNINLWHTLQWISTLMVSRLRLVLRTLMNSIKGRILMPCGEEKERCSRTQKNFRRLSKSQLTVKTLGIMHVMINLHRLELQTVDQVYWF